MDPVNWGDENRLTDTAFDISQAPFARGRFLGDYVGLAAEGGDGLSLFTQPHDTDPASAFLRCFGP